MDLEQASMFLSGSILIVSGFLIILAGVIVGNNLVARYWKSWGWEFSSWSQLRPESDYVTHDEAARIIQEQLKASGTTMDQKLENRTR
jgi:hypothetical protein